MKKGRKERGGEAEGKKDIAFGTYYFRLHNNQKKGKEEEKERKRNRQKEKKG